MKTTFKDSYGDWALITGASSGIGKALATEIANKGLNIVLVARKHPQLLEVSTELRNNFNVSTCVIQADISKSSGINEVIQATKDLQIGMLVLSAGIENNGLFTSNDIDFETKVVDLNIISTLKLTHHFAKKMERLRRGGILFVSSLTGHMASPYFSNYASTKSYVLNFGSSLYAELKPKGVDVSILSPGVTNTPMSAKMGIDWSQTNVPVMEPNEVAKDTIRNFGKKLSIIPGRTNKIMAFMAKKIIPADRFSISNHKMLSKIFQKTNTQTT